MKQRFIEAENKYRTKVSQDPWRLSYHLMPMVGWLNDPNGLCQFQGTYHIFYQYSPEDANGGSKGWGHYSTKDFLHFIQEENALFPDSEIDKDGAYSGSAFVDQQHIHFFYTGNIKFEGDFDYINKGRGHYLNYFSSCDGLHFSEKECLLKNENYPQNMSCHVRDPKVYQEDEQYYLVMGARTQESVGCLLIYKSQDLKNWHYHRTLTTKEKFGYMWECPDLFKLEDQLILITCPQGVQQDGYQYENIYQNGYFMIDGTLEDNCRFSNFVELDYGFDFYAPQTFEDESGRRIMIGWMGLPDIPYTNPTVENSWQHALTLPRELTIKNGHIFQYPIQETEQLRIKHYSKHLTPNETYDYQTHICQLHLVLQQQSFEVKLRKDVTLKYAQQLFTLSLKESGYGRDERHVEIGNVQSIDIYSDSSSLEIFINDGEKVLTTRVYDSKEDTRIEASCEMSLDIYVMKGYQIKKRK